MGHQNMHKMKREAQADSTFASSIGLPITTAVPTGTGIVSDVGGSQTVLTSIVETIAQTVTQPGTTITTTIVRTRPITDPSQYSSLKASESSADAKETSSSSVSSATSSATSKATNASSKSTSNNLSTLIPAIVIPIAVILIASFAVFWFMMRRRHKRQLKEEPEFVMANKNPEKPAISRGNSNSSGTSSTRELVPMSKLEKEVAVTNTSEIRKPSIDLFPPKYTTTDIGLARPMTPPDKAETDKAGNKTPVRNFSRGQNRQSQDIIKPRAGPIPRNAGRNSPSKPSRGPSPAMRGPPNYPIRPARPDDAYRSPRTRSPPNGGPKALATTMHNGNRAPPPSKLDPPTPTGAFNGSSPISQYSPIVKDTPNIGGVVSPDHSARPSRQPSRLTTSNTVADERQTDSPIDENILSHENMRIARLANSSRLGFRHSPIEPTFPRTTTAGPATKTISTRNIELSATSPQLPPPLSREELPRAPFARGPDSPAGGSSIYASPSIGVGQTPRIGGGPSTYSLPQSERTTGVASSTVHAHRASIISRLSSDDGYVDMELDAKSDVSSLDEREKWEMESDRREAGSRLGTGYNGSGYGSAGMSPVDGPTGSSSTSTGNGKPNLRDRDSEGPFVLSRY